MRQTALLILLLAGCSASQPVSRREYLEVRDDAGKARNAATHNSEEYFRLRLTVTRQQTEIEALKRETATLRQRLLTLETR